MIKPIKSDFNIAYHHKPRASGSKCISSEATHNNTSAAEARPRRLAPLRFESERERQRAEERLWGLQQVGWLGFMKL